MRPVRNVVNIGSKIICEATLKEEDWTNLNPALSESDGEVAKEFKNFLKEWQKFYKVRSEYKIAVADIVTFLSELRAWVEKIELGMQSTSSNSRLQLETEMAGQLAEIAIPHLNSLFEKFEKIAETIDDDLKPMHGHYVRQQLHPLMMSAPFAYRAFYKPLGYAGDYEMVNMMARDGLEGGSLFAKLLNRWFLRQPPAAAHRNRLADLVKYIETETLRVAQAAGREARIFNFACGPAVEVQRFIDDSYLNERAEFTLVDFDAKTLEFAQQSINGIIKRRNLDTLVRFKRKSVQQWLKESQKPTEAGNNGKNNYDFVYCAGLFDYLTDAVCKEFTNLLYGMVAPGGLLIVTNVDACNPIKHWLSYILEWDLLYRNKVDMLTLRPEKVKPDNTRLLADSTGVNIYLEIRKPTTG